MTANAQLANFLTFLATERRLSPLTCKHYGRDIEALIKLADKISNVQEIGVDPPVDWDQERCTRYFSWAQEVVDAIGRINRELEKRFASMLESSLRSL